MSMISSHMLTNKDFISADSVGSNVKSVHVCWFQFLFFYIEHVIQYKCTTTNLDKYTTTNLDISIDQPTPPTVLTLKPRPTRTTIT